MGRGKKRGIWERGTGMEITKEKGTISDEMGCEMMADGARSKVGNKRMKLRGKQERKNNENKR